MLISSVCVWIPFAYLLYSFAWGLKEFFRLFTSDRPELPFLTLTASEQNFYAMWYASMALVITFGFVARPMLLLRLSRNAVAMRKRSGIAADLQNLSNFSLFVFSKLAVLYWAVGILLGVNYYFDVYHHRHWLILIVVVLFGNQWLSLNHVFGRAAIRWMVATFVTIVLISFIFSRFPVIKSSWLDNMVAKRQPSNYFRVHLPESPSEAIRSNEINGFNNSLNFGIGYPLRTTDIKPQVFVNDFPFDSTLSKDIGQYIVTQRMYYDEVERYAIAANVSVDKNVKMSVVNNLKKKLSKSSIRRILFTFGSDPSKTYLPQNLPAYCDDYYSGRVDEPFDSVSMMPIICHEAAILAKPDLIVVAQKGDILVNGIKMNLDQLHDKCIQFLNEGVEPRFIKIYVDDNLTFDRYILIYNRLQRAYSDYKDEHYNSELGFTYRQSLKGPYAPVYNSTEKPSKKVRMSAFFELTNAEKEFMIRKLPETKVFFGGKE